MAKKLTKADKAKIWQAKRDQIIKRDNYTCQICGNKPKVLNVHHIIPATWQELYLDDDNLITLCRYCHKFNKYTSPHANGVAFTLWLIDNHEDRFVKLCETYNKVIIKKLSKL